MRNWEEISPCPSFHAFTGCESMSSFFSKSKKSAWATAVLYPDATETFLHFATHPYDPIDCTSPHFSVLEKFTVISYHKESTLLTVNEACRHIFARTTSLCKIFHQHRMLFSSTQGGLFIKVGFGKQVSIQSKMFLHLMAGAGQSLKQLGLQ